MRFAGLAALLFAVSTGWSATVSWEAVKAISGESDVVTEGRRVVAVGFAGSKGESTLNGVVFSVVASLARLPEGVAKGGSFGSSLTVSNRGVPPFSNLPTAYQAILKYSLCTGGSTGIGTLTFSNLTPGKAYLVQLWVNNSYDADASSRSTLVADNDGMVSAVALVHSHAASGSSGGVGSHVVGRFTADGESQTFYVKGKSSKAYLSAFQLRSLSSGSSPTYIFFN